MKHGFYVGNNSIKRRLNCAEGLIQVKEYYLNRFHDILQQRQKLHGLYLVCLRSELHGVVRNLLLAMLWAIHFLIIS